VWEDSEGQVWHLLQRGLEKDDVQGHIDWERRFDHMQQHSGQHLLSAAFIEVLDAPTIGFHLGSETSTIDLDIEKVDWEMAFEVEERVNMVVWENRPVAVHFVTQDEVHKVPLRKSPQVEGTIRVIWVEGFDASACGGTHVSRTGEVGLVKISGLERYKGDVRVTFLCGRRALKDYREVLRTIQGVSAGLSVHPDELPEAIKRLEEEAKTSRKALNKAMGELMKYEAARLWEEAPTRDGIRQVVAHWENRSFADARKAASSLRERPRTLALLAVSEEDGVKLVCARSDDLEEVNAAEVLRRLVEPLGGRGGGSQSMAQGGAPPKDPSEIQDVLNKTIKS
jgi:alanyl-tRNA synthetase